MMSTFLAHPLMQVNLVAYIEIEIRIRMSETMTEIPIQFTFIRTVFSDSKIKSIITV